MIIINLKGGLGNQMFQYAFGRAYSLQFGDEMKLDITGFPHQTLRSYGLQAFSIKENIATDEEIRRLKYPRGFLSKAQRAFSQKILRRYYLDYHPSLLKPKKDVYFDGFFQSENYFLPIQDIIRREFTLLEGLSPAAMAIREKIEAAAIPISLHVRRKDYVSDSKTASIHDVCGPDYYEKAACMIGDGYPEATFFVFSDDMEWAKANIILPMPAIYVSAPSIMDAEELVLMSHCTHHIIANSSFSWWGAWLNPDLNKVVIAPKKWTNVVPEDHPNIIPKTWTRI